MSREVILNRVINVIKEVLMDDSIQITENSYLVDELELGSLEIMEMVAELEEEFGITIPEEKMNGFVQVKDFIDYLETV